MPTDQTMPYNQPVPTTHAWGIPEHPENAPFVIEHHQEDRTSGGIFRPGVRLVLTERVRTSGLWRALTPEDFKTLILVLTFVTSNGWCRPTLPELADAMGVSNAKAKARLDRLTQIQWQGQRVAELLSRPDGLDAYLPGRPLLAHEDTPPLEPPQAVLKPIAGRDVLIAHSRAQYAHTREEVERQIEAIMGWAPPIFAGDDPAVAEGKSRAFKVMTDFGISKEQALDLLSRFDLGAIERQIHWLPERHAKSPARFLVAAIEGNYDRPFALRNEANDTNRQEQPFKEQTINEQEVRNE